MDDREIHIREARWPDDQSLLRTVRRIVFVQEQGVPETLEWDGRDEDARHLLALTGTNEPVGTARLLGSGRIGRMAVLPAYRNQGIGGRMLASLIGIARRQGILDLELHAQVKARHFYERHGFHVMGDTFMAAGIPHIAMVRTLKMETDPTDD